SALIDEPAGPGDDAMELASGTEDSGLEAQDEDDDDEAADQGEQEDGDERAAKRKRADDEPASFLAMYFRDMAELDVLRPEQEFEPARKIEEMEIDLWRPILGFAPGASWIMDVVDRAVGKALADGRPSRAAAERARRKSSIQARSRFEKAGS